MTTLNEKRAIAGKRVEYILQDLRGYENHWDMADVFALRNEKLLIDRHLNIFSRCTQLEKTFLPRIQNAKSEQDLVQAMGEVEAELRQGKDLNANIGSKHYAIHGSWSNARLAGHGLFRSFKALVTGSRAERAFDRGLAGVSELSTRLGVSSVPQPQQRLMRSPVKPTIDEATVTLDEVVKYLGGYLANYNYTVQDAEPPENQHFYWYRQDNQYFVSPSYGYQDRDTDLSLKRIACIHNIRKTINEWLTSDFPKRNDQDEIVTTIQHAYKLLHEGWIGNNHLSAYHGKDHRSSKYNQTLNCGMFGSWLKKTWIQSRAGTALEKSMQELKKFSKRFGIPLQVQPEAERASPPPPSYAAENLPVAVPAVFAP